MGFLGVDTSLTGRTWVGPTDDVRRAAEAMEQQTDLPSAVCAVMARLGVPSEAATKYLEPQLRDLLPDPLVLKDMNTAAARIVHSVRSKQKVAIFADYDVDGATSGALLVTWFRHFGIHCTLYIPDRITEGYGPNAPAMSDLASQHDLIICVDCGTLSHEAIAAAESCDVIVLDHHLGGETLPDCLAVVNPNRQDENGDLAHLCAAGVVFLTLVECSRQMRDAGPAGPNLLDMLDLVALGTVADVAPLIGVNRAFVRQGLKVMARRGRIGLVALSDAARLDGMPTAYHLGYLLGPRINAGGRIGQADLGAKLLCSTDPIAAQAMADKLNQLNDERRDIEQAVRLGAFEQAEQRGLDGPLVWAAGAGWHPGVVGIVASRLKEASNRPSIVIGIEDGIGKGSGRSVSGIDLGAAIHKLSQEGLLIKGGGHKMAAGLSVAEEKIPAAMERLSELMTAQGAANLGAPDLRLDGMLMPMAATVELCDAIEQAGPFGAGAAGPRYCFASMKINYARRVGDTHLKLRFGDGLGHTMDAICFGAYDSDLGAALENHRDRRVHLAGKLDINIWQGRKTVQLRLEDAAFVST